MDSQLKVFIRLISVTALLTYFIIVIGATVRVYDAGMACPDWPLCYGQILPFPVPEGAEYTAFQVLLEWGHRALAAVVGFFMIAAFVHAFRMRKRHPKMLNMTLPPLAVLFVQVKLGGLTVFMENIHWSVAIHLGCAMIFFGLLIWLRKVAAQPENPTLIYPTRRTQAMAWSITLLVWVTMLAGAMVSSAHAGGSCGGLFSCFGSWWSDDFQQMLHMKHRYLALVTTLGIVLFYFQAKNEHEALYRSARGLKILLAGQLLIGVLVLYSFSHYANAYKALSVFHLAWGTLLFMACIGTLGKMYLGLEGGFHRNKKTG